MLNKFNWNTCTCLSYSFTIHAHLYNKHRTQNATRFNRTTHGLPQAVNDRRLATRGFKAYMTCSSREDSVGAGSSSSSFSPSAVPFLDEGQPRGKGRNRKNARGTPVQHWDCPMQKPPGYQEPNHPALTPVINLSSKSLSQPHIDLLSKGLSFIPTARYQSFNITIDVYKFICKLKLWLYFREHAPPAFAAPSSFNPLP